MKLGELVTRGAAAAAVLGVRLEWHELDGRLMAVRVLGVPLFDRRRLEARRAARAARKERRP